jgi:hypothetical protein
MQFECNRKKSLHLLNKGERDPSSQKEWMTNILRLRGGFFFDPEEDDLASFDIKLAWSSAEQDLHRPRLVGHQKKTRSEAEDIIRRYTRQYRIASLLNKDITPFGDG